MSCSQLRCCPVAKLRGWPWRATTWCFSTRTGCFSIWAAHRLATTCPDISSSFLIFLASLSDLSVSVFFTLWFTRGGRGERPGPSASGHFSSGSSSAWLPRTSVGAILRMVQGSAPTRLAGGVDSQPAAGGGRAHDPVVLWPHCTLLSLRQHRPRRRRLAASLLHHLLNGRHLRPNLEDESDPVRGAGGRESVHVAETRNRVEKDSSVLVDVCSRE